VRHARRHEERVAGRERVADVRDDELAMPGLDEVKLVLRMRGLRIDAVGA
jgi:hypothetical protein